MAWLVGAAAVAGVVVSAGLVDVSGMLRPAAPAPVAAPAPAATSAPPFVKVVKAAEPAAVRSGSAGCGGGRHQREIERNLATLGAYRDVTVDGESSAADCAAIRAFQQRYGVRPARGQADATTADVARRIATASAPANLARCQISDGVTACVDLTTQTTWVVRDGAVVFGPTVVRTGYRGHATPAGTYTINKRAKREWSNPYEVWLPFWQRFVGGIGFHETTTYLHDKARGSHGCVNLLPADAAAMWDQLETGTEVHTFGRRPGT
ncbi:L,D-transpeptidase family protein [Actinoplanes aureus]|uniref:L,D-transpeptidase family protein n=1 Tax=Actinoplanes aureus TaxID=2792083 RepID=UPI002814E34B|nr:L,D-transpeptidase family protein [Actinoplanes aureus]